MEIMKYEQKITLKNGKEALIRNGNTAACIQCAREEGYGQLELNVVAENDRALSLYRSLGFVEFGRNPQGFHSRTSGYQELVYMLLKL
jgi:ribosomal protein S18 acetylase RimI-like enzyme